MQGNIRADARKAWVKIGTFGYSINIMAKGDLRRLVDKETGEIISSYSIKTDTVCQWCGSPAKVEKDDNYTTITCTVCKAVGVMS